MTGRRTLLDLVVVGPDAPLAACKGQGDAWDGAVEGETARERQKRHLGAMRVCEGCPERLPCLRYRLEHPQLAGDGVWGGHVFDDHRGRGEKPRKGRNKKMRSGICAFEGCDTAFDTLQDSRRFCSRKHRRAQEQIDRRARGKATRKAA